MAWKKCLEISCSSADQNTFLHFCCSRRRSIMWKVTFLFCNPYLLQNNCKTFMLEAASFPSDNKIVSQVVHNIMGLTQQR